MYSNKSWANDAIFYHIYPLGLCGAPEANSFSSEPVNRLERLFDWVPHMKSLGCNALYLGPVFESDFHGYDTADYFLVDRRLGVNDTLKDLSDKLHESDIKLVLDTVFNHVGRNFWAFLDLKINGKDSKYIDWFCDVDFSQDNVYEDGFVYQGWYSAYNLVKLNLKNDEVKDYLFKVVAFWMEEFKIDGLRFDVAEIMDKQFLSELATFIRQRDPNCWLMGEVIKGDYNQWANRNTLDSTTNYEGYYSLYSSHNDNNYFDLSYTLNRQFGEFGVYRDLALYNFADNHDTSRIKSILTNEQHLFTVYTFLFTLPGIPSVYYGSEWGMLGIKGQSSDEMLRPEVTAVPDLSDNKLFKYTQLLTHIRKNNITLREGNYLQLFVANQHFVFQRYTENDLVIIAINAWDQSVSIAVPVLKEDGTEFIDELQKNDISYVLNNVLTILDIPPYGARILTQIPIKTEVNHLD
jgi:cyclomaltodextrinase